MNAAVGEILEWDSTFFGFAIGRVGCAALGPQDAHRILAWAQEHRLRCVTFLADADDIESIWVAEDIGFRHVDVRVTREREVARGPTTAAPLEAARQDEVPALLAIARRSHHETRFYRDPHFPNERCHELYARWIERGLEEPTQEVLVVRRPEGPAGYVVCSDVGSGCGRISLIAVDATARGQGAGSSLVEGGLGWMASRGCNRAEVVGQGQNVEASRLYERMGFRTSRVELWFHLWLDEARS